MSRVMALASGVRRYIAAVTLLRVAATVSVVIQGFLMASVLTDILDGAAVADVSDTLLVIVAVFATRAVLVWLAGWVGDRTASTTKQALRRRCFAKLGALGPGYTAGERTGELNATLVEDIESLEKFYSSFLPSVATVVLGPLIVIGVLWNQDTQLGIVLAAIVAAGALIPIMWMHVLEASNDARMRTVLAMGATFLDTLQGMTTLKAFGASGRRRAELERTSDELVRRWSREMRRVLIVVGVFSLATVGGLGLVVTIAAFRTADGDLEPRVLFLTLLLTAEATRALGALATTFHTSYSATTAAQRLTSLLDTPALIGPTTSTSWQTLPDATITFDTITFSYPTSPAPVLDAFSLTIAAGDTVAVVGPSGSGKSTLVALLARFFEPQRGSVRIGGIDTSELPLDQVRSLISVVSQDTYLFCGSARDNIAMAKPDATDDEIIRAAKSAGIHDYLIAQPDGYDTIVGERGTRLSGGQRQRIAIARALLADRPILVLDEATASIDAETEAAVQRELDTLREGRTTLVIAHRLSTVRDADRIVVLDTGRAVETGSHTELLATSGRYAQLISAQERS